MSKTDRLLDRLQALIDAAQTAHFAPPATRRTLEDTVALIQAQQAELDRLRAGVAALTKAWTVEPPPEVDA